MMMLFYAALFASAAAAFANPIGLPSFEWVKNGAALPLLKINFPDGRESDFAELKHFNIIPAGRNEDPSQVDSCIYDGYLTNEKSVYVTLTGGCVYSKTFEVQFRSKRLRGHMFKVTNGVVEELAPIVSRQIQDHFIRKQFSTQAVTSRGAVPNPGGYSLKIRIRYDDQFKAKLGDDSENTIRRIMAHAQNIWKWKDSLTTQVIFNIESIEHKAGDWNVQTTGPGSGSDITYNMNDGDRSIEFLYFSTGHEGGIAGRASGAICSPWSQKGVSSLIELYGTEIQSGNTVAHEIGHNFGMAHDFDQTNGNSDDPRFDSKGQKCTGIGGIMDYGVSKTIWTTCSVEDLIKYINETNQYNEYPWCLAELP